jgi:hypothetical protein
VACPGPPKGRVSRNGELRDADPDRLLEASARRKVGRYREAYATRLGVTYAFLPCILATSGRLHGEFLRLLYIIAHGRTTRWFARMGNDHPSDEAFKFRRGEYFWHTRASIGHAAARAVAARARVAEHTRAAPVLPPTRRMPCSSPRGPEGRRRRLLTL